MNITPVYIVEATEYEHLCLYEKFRDSVHLWILAKVVDVETAGYIAGEPIVVNLHVDFLDNLSILFYSASGIIISYRIIDKYLDRMYKDIPRCDAMAFVNQCLSYLTDYSKKAE